MTRAVTCRIAAAVVLCAVAGSSTAFAGSAVRSSGFGYDATSGLLTQEVIEPNTSALRLETDYVYDAFGHKVSATVNGVDIVSRSSTTTYDAKGEFAVSSTNALGQGESWQYDPRFGTPTSHTGPNGLTTTWSYDTFGRKITEVRADGTQTKWVYSFCSGVNGGTATCPTGASYLIQTTSFAANGTTQNAPTLLVYFDLLDREVARDTQGFDGSTVRGSKQYDALGRVSKTSRPYFLATGTPQWNSFTYDTLGRVVSATAADGSVSQTAFHGLVVTETNALNQTRTVTKNSQGQVVSVTDALSQTMTYTYDPLGNLTKTTDAVGNIVTATYDTRGRKVASNDPDLGAWTYTYDTLGELQSQTDAKGQITSITYDKLSRPLQRVEPDMTSVWVYDTAANGIGKPASASITSGAASGYQRIFSYDTLGRPTQVSTTVGGAAYIMAAAYDSNSRLSQVTYPSGFVANYAYNNLGYANQMSDGGAQTFWTLNGMDAEQHITQQTSGNGVATTLGFSATNGRLLSVAAGPSNTVQNLSFSYDLLGNLTNRTDSTSNLSESITYDQLNRMLTATVSSNIAPVKNISYSPIGNILSKSDLGTYAYASPGSPLPHAVMSISGSTLSTTFTYDPNGNQTGGLGRTISWTAANRPASITQGTNTISFQYGVNHERVMQIAPDGTTLYFNAFGVSTELFGAGTGAARWTDYLSVGSAKVGMRVINIATETISTHYFHTDHLGSISVITDENGVVLERLSYDAWGKRRFATGADDPTGSITSQSTRGFTGQEQLDTVALVHLNGRVYDPMVGRMVSADPTVPDPLNAQAWNRYSYVGNDPLTFTDPSGFSWLSNAFHSITHFLTSNPIVRAIVQIGVTVILTAILGPAGAGFTIAQAAASAAATGAAIVTGLSGGNLGQILRASAIAGLTAFAFNVVGSATNVVEGENFDLSAPHIQPAFGTDAYAFNVVGHALVGCGAAVANGSSCGSGALSGGITAGAGPLINGQSFGVSLVENTVLGGIASVAGGGKFANGAITGAFGYLFNKCGASCDFKPDPDGGISLGDIAEENPKAAVIGAIAGLQISALTLGSSTLVAADLATEGVDLTAAQAANLARFIDKLPSAAGPASVDALGNDSVIFTATVPGRVPGSSAVYQKIVDGLGRTTDYLKTTFDNLGNVVNTKTKF